MPRMTRGPQGAVHLSTYRELEEFISAFSLGHINLLILVGAPGLAKSRTVREQLGEGTCWIEGNATPFGMYSKLYRYRDKFVVIDDVDSLYADRNGVRLLKCLCQTEEQKSVAWQSAARSLERENIPREFVTSSRVIVICNDWKTLNRNVVALQDRGHTLVFEPTAEEVHRKTGEWFDQDTDIYEWFSENLHLVREPSMRLYLRASELKRAGMDWMDIIPLAPEDQRQRWWPSFKQIRRMAPKNLARRIHRPRRRLPSHLLHHSRRLKAKGVNGNAGAKRRITVPVAAVNSAN